MCMSEEASLSSLFHVYFSHNFIGSSTVYGLIIELMGAARVSIVAAQLFMVDGEHSVQISTATKKSKRLWS